jgi:N-acetylglucosaminyldiphosphoundecaprenol N-acetyl-beta-D-mannosaminyltransferase
MKNNLYGYVLNSRVSALSFNDVVSEIEAWVKSGSKRRYVCICNTHSLVTAVKNKGFKKVLEEADLCTPDGMPLVWALKLNGFKNQERVDGPNLLLRLSERSAKEGYKIFLYGGTEEVLDRLEKKLKMTFKGINIVGKYSPPFRDLSQTEVKEIINKINNANPDITFVSLGCPKQEIWMNNNYDNINSVLIGVGAAFNYAVGDINRPPLILQKLGLEWLFRLVSEPQRLWKRYLYNNTVFIYEFIKTFRKNKLKTSKLNK